MSGFKIEKQTAATIDVLDLGITLFGAAGTIVDITNLSPQDVSRSADLISLISGGDILVVDSRDPTDATIHTLADSLLAVQEHNTSHLGIIGGRFGSLDDPTISINDEWLIAYNAGAGEYESIPITWITSNTTFIEETQDLVGAMGINGTDTTFTYNDVAGTIEWSVNDVFLRNTGDTLDSGTLNIAEGATLNIIGDGGGGGSTFTIGQDATATIQTPTGGFTGDTDIINKAYVDQVAAGLDWKESARVATAGTDITAVPYNGTYNAAGGPSSTGEFTGVDLSSATGGSIDGIFFTGNVNTGLVIGDRVLIKDDGVDIQNGIYEITAAPSASNVTLTRAPDQDGVGEASEVSGGNTVYIEDTTNINANSVNSDTAWSLSFDGIVSLNTDPLNWVQVAGPGTLTARDGLSRDGNVFDLDVNDLAAATITGADSIAFHDVDGVANSSGSQTRNTTIANMLADLDIVNNITTNGMIVRTADDTYATRTIVSAGLALEGIDVVNGDGVAGNPTIGIDIQNRTARTDAVDGVNDLVLVYNASSGSNEAYSVNDIAAALSSVNSFETWAGGGNTTGDASIVADSGTDTATLSGGIGINVDVASLTDTLTLSFTQAGMANTAVTTADTVPFFDTSNASEPEFRSWADIITDLGISTSGNTNVFETLAIAGNTTGVDTNIVADSITDTATFNGGIGITLSAVTATDNLTWTFTNAGMADTAVVDSDTVPFFDASNANEAEFRSWANIITDLGILTGGNSVYWTTISLTGNQAGDISVSPATAADVLTLNGGTGVRLTGADVSDTISLEFVRDGMADIAVTTADTVPFFDASNVNEPEYRSWANIITDLGILTSGVTAYWGDINTTGNVVGDTTPAASPDASADALTFNAGIGITLSGTAVSDTLSWAFSRAGMADTVVTLADTVPFFDATNSNEPEYRSFGDTFQDLDVPHNMGAGTGIVVKTADAPDVYTYRSIDASANEDLLGIDVTNGDGVAGNPTIGLDILNLTNPVEDMAADDEFALHNKSEGTAGANRKITGQEIADGVANILNINTLTISTINGQLIATITDSTRANKQLSIDSHTYAFSDNLMSNGSWIEIGNAVDTDASWIMPFNGTVVGVTAMTEDCNGNTYDIHLFVNAADQGAIATLTGTGVDTDVDVTLNLDFAQGDRLRLRAVQTAGTSNSGDVTVGVMVRWRA